LQDAAERRLQEELGFGVALTPASIFTYEAPVGGDLIEHERVHVFRGSTEKSQLTLSPDPQEVADTRWTTPDTLRAEIKANPHDFAPWFRIYLERWGDLRL
jgi:isopentenyl-diphosphate delta-isomerase